MRVSTGPIQQAMLGHLFEGQTNVIMELEGSAGRPLMGHFLVAGIPHGSAGQSSSWLRAVDEAALVDSVLDPLDDTHQRFGLREGIRIEILSRQVDGSMKVVAEKVFKPIIDEPYEEQEGQGAGGASITGGTIPNDGDTAGFEASRSVDTNTENEGENEGDQPPDRMAEGE